MDRVSELQCLIDQLGILMYQTFEQISPPATLNPAEQKEASAKFSQEQMTTFASKIVGTCKTIELYIDSLPGIESTEEYQLKRIEELEEENKLYEAEILKYIEIAETKLSTVRSSLAQIAQDQLNLADG